MPRVSGVLAPTAIPGNLAPAGRSGGERTDIQALRALAVGSVLVFHLWPDQLTGGYVGVDVFFVISGFLITSHLLREVIRTGRIRVGTFWARRAKRLLPASLLVLAVTTAAAAAWVPESLWRQYFNEVIGSALYVQNWVLAGNSVDYLAADNTPSPVQHFWTLSTEEQFYLALPLLVLLSIAIARRTRLPARRVITVVVLAGVSGSLTYSIVFTSTGSPAAYFSTFTRAWEFGAGALLALVGVRFAGRGRHVIAAGGVALIVVGCWTFNSATAFPGYAAALPVVGTLLAIAAGSESVIASAGRVRPVRFIGDVSYAIYLWHWPMVVLIPFVTGVPLRFQDKIVIVALTLLLAWASTTFIENPVRFSPRLLGGARRPRAVAAWSLSAMVLVILAAGAPLVVHAHRVAAQQGLTVDLLASRSACLGAQAMDPALAPCTNPAIDGTLVPAPAAAQQDDNNRHECWGTRKFCSFGPAEGWKKHLLAVGDSHNNAYMSAYQAIAELNGWRIDVTGTGGCYWTTASRNRPPNREAGCLDWRGWLEKYILTTGPYDAVITTHSSPTVMLTVPGQSMEKTISDGLAAAWKPVVDAGTSIVAIVDHPAVSKTDFACVESAGLSSPDGCAIPRSVAMAHFDGSKQAAQGLKRVHVVDLTDFLCTATLCPQIIGHVVVYRPDTHLTATFVDTLAPYLNRKIVAALR